MRDFVADSVPSYAKCEAPPGRSGPWVLERFEVAARESAGFLAAFVDVDHDGALEIYQGGLADARTATARAAGTRPVRPDITAPRLSGDGPIETPDLKRQSSRVLLPFIV